MICNVVHKIFPFPLWLQTTRAATALKVVLMMHHLWLQTTNAAAALEVALIMHPLWLQTTK